MNFSLLLATVLLNVVRGSKAIPSLIGVKQCSPEDWFSMVIFVLYCAACTAYSVRQAQKVQAIKHKYEPAHKQKEIQLNGFPLFELISISFMGGVVSGALGQGGGSIFNPMLLSFGVPPSVSSATGMYMIIFSTGASTFTYILNDMLQVSYGVWTGGFCILGSIGGMYLSDLLMARIKRQSPQVFLLCFLLTISAIAVPYFGVDIQQTKIRDMLKFNNIC